jgi:hypothetical protein
MHQTGQFVRSARGNDQTRARFSKGGRAGQPDPGSGSSHQCALAIKPK